MTVRRASRRFARPLVRLLSHCACALPGWGVELSRTVAGVTVRAEARSK